mgnify:CR=1 FL=1
MMDDDLTIDKYEQYGERFAPEWTDGQRVPWTRARHKSRRSRAEILAELTDDVGDVELGFQTTYHPSKHERGWLLSSLYSFYEEGLITDVLALVKGGKEANVYCCQAHPATGLGLLAAKVYRPRMFRNLRNDKMYRQGREILVAGGGTAGRDSGYIERAIRNKTPFGEQAAHTSWLMYEFTALERLHGAGGSVPKPIAASDNAILMGYHGDELMAAPTLNSVALEPSEARRHYREVLRNVDLLLQHDLIHGDLSAYNILYWQPEGSPAEITLIDFPQVVNLRTNENARNIFERDIELTCEYFAQQGVDCRAGEVAARLWSRYVTEMDPEDRAADWSRLLADLEELPGDVVLDPIPL